MSRKVSPTPPIPGPVTLPSSAPSVSTSPSLYRGEHPVSFEEGLFNPKDQEKSDSTLSGRDRYYIGGTLRNTTGGKCLALVRRDDKTLVMESLNKLEFDSDSDDEKSTVEYIALQGLQSTYYYAIDKRPLYSGSCCMHYGRMTTLFGVPVMDVAVKVYKGSERGSFEREISFHEHLEACLCKDRSQTANAQRYIVTKLDSSGGSTVEFQAQEVRMIVYERGSANLWEWIRRDDTKHLELSKLVLAPILEALEFLHDFLGVVHCDLKPDNILMFFDGDKETNRFQYLKVIDFESFRKIGEVISARNNLFHSFEFTCPEVLKLALSRLEDDPASEGLRKEGKPDADTALELTRKHSSESVEVSTSFTIYERVDLWSVAMLALHLFHPNGGWYLFPTSGSSDSASRLRAITSDMFPNNIREALDSTMVTFGPLTAQARSFRTLVEKILLEHRATSARQLLDGHLLTGALTRTAVVRELKEEGVQLSAVISQQAEMTDVQRFESIRRILEKIVRPYLYSLFVTLWDRQYMKFLKTSWVDLDKERRGRCLVVGSHTYSEDLESSSVPSIIRTFNKAIATDVQVSFESNRPLKVINVNQPVTIRRNSLVRFSMFGDSLFLVSDVIPKGDGSSHAIHVYCKDSIGAKCFKDVKIQSSWAVPAVGSDEASANLSTLGFTPHIPDPSKPKCKFYRGRCSIHCLNTPGCEFEATKDFAMDKISSGKSESWDLSILLSLLCNDSHSLLESATNSAADTYESLKGKVREVKNLRNTFVGHASEMTEALNEVDYKRHLSKIEDCLLATSDDEVLSKLKRELDGKLGSRSPGGKLFVDEGESVTVWFPKLVEAVIQSDIKVVPLAQVGERVTKVDLLTSIM